MKEKEKVIDIKKIVDLLIKYKEVILYLIFGVLTTLVNFLTYILLARCFDINQTVSNAVAWIVSVLFAYVTNKIWVFESKSTKAKTVIIEMLSFIGCRVVSGILDIAMFYIMVEKLFMNDIIVKIIISIFVIVLNYVFSKLLIFKNTNTKNIG